jgi:hypothetical protein
VLERGSVLAGSRAAIGAFVRRRRTVVASTAIAAVMVTAVASADIIRNTVDDSVDAVAEEMPLTLGGANGTTQLLVVPQGGDGKPGCNLTGSTSLGLSVTSSNTAVATVSPSSVTFNSCGDAKTLTVTPVASGTATISVSQTSNNTGGTFNLAPATFTVKVAPPPNTAPTISVAGVTGGASYDKGSVPGATCQVTDAEDGNSSFAATLSAVIGDNAADGIGLQTASCSYTDAGGLTVSASETYNIIDPTAPTIDATRTPTDPDGLNGWYTSDVTLAWDVKEPQSPNSLAKTGCADQSITADQAEETYSCSATSAGGSAGPVDVKIKRDATKPTIGGSASPAANGAGWNNEAVDVTFQCADNLSGVDTCGPGTTLSSEGRDQSVNGTATDFAGNSDSVTVGNIDIDTSAPNAPSASADRAADYAGDGGWYKDTVTVGFDGAGDPKLSNGDDGSGVDATTVPADKTFNTSGSHTASGTVKDLADNESSAGSLEVQVDADKPKVTPTCPADPVLKGASASATWEASDGQSGLKTAATGSTSLSTSAVGTQTATVPAGTAEDNVGHGSDAATCTYSVVYDFRGFFQPIDNKDAAGNYVLNKAKVGSTVPVKFSLAGDQGLGILSGAPQTASIPCTASNSDLLEEYGTATVSGLKYDAAANQYIYNWKTQSIPAGSCRQLIVKLDDGTSHRANFTFFK